MYYGEDQLFDNIDHEVPFIPYDDIRDASRPPNPTPGGDSVNSADFDYAFLQIQDVEQLHSIQEFMNTSLVCDRCFWENWKCQLFTILDRSNVTLRLQGGRR